MGSTQSTWGLEKRTEKPKHVGFLSLGRPGPVFYVSWRCSGPSEEGGHCRQAGPIHRHVWCSRRSQVQGSRRAQSKRIDVNLKIDGGASKTDGLFDLNLNYLLEHGDGDGDETGTLTLKRAKKGDTWVSQLKTET